MSAEDRALGYQGAGVLTLHIGRLAVVSAFQVTTATVLLALVLSKQAQATGYLSYDAFMTYYWREYAFAVFAGFGVFAPAAAFLALRAVHNPRVRDLLYAAGPAAMASALVALRWPIALP